MRKALLTIAAAGLIMTAMAVPSFAAEWKQDTAGWWYQQDDGGYPSGGWSWIEGKCYYFDDAGYCLLDTTTPDGYTVDASGAWIVNGEVQTKESQETTDIQTQEATEPVHVGNLVVTPPAGFVKVAELSSMDCVYFANAALDGIVGVASEDIPNMGGYESLLDSVSENVIDFAMSSLGTVDEKSTREFTSGAWYCYRFANAQEMGFDGQLYVNARIRNAKVEMVLFMGNLVGMNMDGIMNENVK